MSIEIDGKDYCVQFTETAGTEWKSAGVFADPYSAKEHAERVLHDGNVASVRVIQTRYYGWRDPEGQCGRDDIGQRDGDLPPTIPYGIE